MKIKFNFFFCKINFFQRARASTITPGQAFPNSPPQNKLLPTVFKWEGGGKAVYVSGSFDNWKSKIPMAKRFVLFFKIS